MLYLLLATDEAEAEAAPNPILPVPNELFWGAISFAVLYLLIRYVLLPPVQRVRNDRAATIQADRDAADAARAQVASASSELDDQLADVRAEAATIIEEARAEAEAERQRLVARADREVSAMKEIAETEISREREEAMASLRPQVANLAVGAASKVMNRQISLDSVRPVIDRSLDNPN
ncbi:MAG: F0F1 ATP synthase subunit B [Acidimicrobiales bacterium]